ncbi:DUF1801 domain-containing protein [Flavobacterium sp.]|uniref:DUF1801 domain-containing protein n=1 Tax=Flavobacterium sp. TaxID=239 RepID=UPI00261AAF46|nr:DUF1801 domain-containing protein [Flavobacterium sp.]
MQSSAKTPDQYISELPEDRKEVMQKLRDVTLKNLPKGFEEQMSYGMLGYVVPHSIYPNGYHCNTKDPLPFFAIASQKNSINIYHMMVYSDKNLHDWFSSEYPKYCKSKLDMGKSCIRFKKIDDIPFELIGELLSKITVEQWISEYEKVLKK